MRNLQSVQQASFEIPGVSTPTHKLVAHERLDTVPRSNSWIMGIIYLYTTLRTAPIINVDSVTGRARYPIDSVTNP